MFSIDIDLRSDRELLAAHVAGDRHAFAELFRRHQPRLLRVAQATSRNPEDAADALQEAMLHAHRSAGKFRHHSTVGSWLHRIVVNACIDNGRRNALRHTVLLTDGMDPASDGSAAADTAIMLRCALSGLPDDQRAALEIVDMLGYSISEAAGLLGVAEGTVKSRRARARTKLAVTLRRHPAR